MPGYVEKQLLKYNHPKPTNHNTAHGSQIQKSSASQHKNPSLKKKAPHSMIQERNIFNDSWEPVYIIAEPPTPLFNMLSAR